MKKYKKSSPIQYDYYVHTLSEDNESAYQAIIPAFDNAIVFGDTLKELEKGVKFTIESEISERKKFKKPIPKPEKKISFNGKILIRVSPLLHEQIVLEAKANGQSLNKFIEQRLIDN
jgi:predicted HicB family RNase H-like nuclease